jgi:hypothetical protein
MLLRAIKDTHYNMYDTINLNIIKGTNLNTLSKALSISPYLKNTKIMKYITISSMYNEYMREYFDNAYKEIAEKVCDRTLQTLPFLPPKIRKEVKKSINEDLKKSLYEMMRNENLITYTAYFIKSTIPQRIATKSTPDVIDYIAIALSREIQLYKIS